MELCFNPREEGDPDQQLAYTIKLHGHLDESWSVWFEDMQMIAEIDGNGRPITVIEGYVPDQAALRGVINRIWDLKLTLISVSTIDQDDELLDENTNGG
jgi:hypothetical protein